MNKAITAFNLQSLIDQANRRIVALKGNAVNDITEDIHESEDDFMIVICRKPGDKGSFKEPQNVPINKNPLKLKTVKVFCEEYLKDHSERKLVEYFRDQGNIFSIALIYNDPKFVEKPEEKVKSGKKSKKIEMIKDPGAPAKALIAALTSGHEVQQSGDLPDKDEWDS
jgi:hypothetical protein